MKYLTLILFILTSCNSSIDKENSWWTDYEEFERRNSKNIIVFERVLGKEYINYYYSKKNKLIEKQILNSDSILIEKHLYHYDDFENLVIELVLYYGNQQNEFPNVIYYTYDNKYKLIYKSEFNGFGQICNNTSYQYQSPLIIYENETARFGGLSSKRIRYLNKKGLTEKELTILESGDTLSKYFEYDLYGNVIIVNKDTLKYFYNKKGQWVRKIINGQISIRQYKTE